MQRRRLRAGVILLLAVAALGAAGAAVDQRGGGAGSSGTGGGSGMGSGDGSSVAANPVEGFTDPLFATELLVMVIGILGIVGAVVGIAYGVLTVLDLDLSKLRAVLWSVGSKLAVAVLVVVLLYSLVQLFDGTGGGSGSGVFGGEAEGVSGTTSDTGVELPIAFGVAVVAIAALAVLVIRRSNGGEDDPEAPATDPGDLTGANAAASPVASGVGRPPADNEVYRAWLSLADAAGADPRRATPGTVADRAISAGVDEDDAREITSLFESVRYGRRDVDDGLERRAKRARSRVVEGP